MSMIQDNNFPKPYQSSYIKTDDGHDLYYELIGNPNAFPIVFLHGGPGSGFQKNHRDLFNLEKSRVVFVDQRGAGRSKPRRSFKNNSTDYLIEDLELIRKRLNIEKWLVVGGSWGSTLALAYAQKYGKCISGIVIRSVFLGTKDEILWAFTNAAQLFRPELWDSWKNLANKDVDNIDPLLFYGKKLESNDKFDAESAAIIWSVYESILSQIEGENIELPKSFNKKYFSNSKLKPNTPFFEWHYIKNNFFLDNKQLINNAYKLNGIPGIIVQGRYDLLCPPINAFSISEKWKDCELYLIDDAGHSANSGPMRQALINAIKDLVDKNI